jgi:23S rRNA pseudouridine1911/1915/1917 synthase
MRVCPDAAQAKALRARPAVTRYRPLQRTGRLSLLAVEIPTGVMHQIRAHLASIGHPIVGDALYGGSSAPRQMLHATRITFRHPSTGRRLRVDSPLPADVELQMRAPARR